MQTSNTNGISAVFTEIYDSNSGVVNNANTPYDKFDILYVAFAHIDKDTYELDFEDVADGGKAAEKERLQNILNLTASLRQAGKLKVVISLGWGEQFNDIPLIEEHLDIFAPSVLTFLQDNDLDGFDIDYETPTFSSNAKFQEVSEAIQQQLGSEYLFSITPNNTTFLDGYTLSKYYNYVNVQCYDYRGDRSCPITNFTQMPGMDLSKITAGADVSNGDKIESAISKYQTNDVGGVFAWELATNFDAIADAMYFATRILTAR